MKTVKLNNGTIKRLSDQDAKEIVESQGGSYCAKKLWKDLGNHGPAPAVKVLKKSVNVEVAE